MSIITKKIDNKIIFYDKDVGINIEELFSDGAFATDESTFSVGKYTNDWLKNKTVMELRTLGFEYTKRPFILSSEISRLVLKLIPFPRKFFSSFTSIKGDEGTANRVDIVD